MNGFPPKKKETMPPKVAGQAIATMIGDVFWDAWFIMLLIGDLHLWDHSIPTIGYWTALPISWIIVATLKSSADRAVKYTQRPKGWKLEKAS